MVLKVGQSIIVVFCMNNVATFCVAKIYVVLAIVNVFKVLPFIVLHKIYVSLELWITIYLNYV